MTDLRVSENTKLTSLPDGWANAPELQRVVLWDIGPERPAPPVKPKPPNRGPDEAEYDLAMIDFRLAIADYEAALGRFRQAKIEYDDFQTRYGGPYEIPFWSCDAQDALRYDREAAETAAEAGYRAEIAKAPDPKAAKAVVKQEPRLRYHISSKTRGYGHLNNLGLPRGLRPGPGHAAQEERARQGAVDLEAAKRADPVFGKEVGP